MRTVTQTFNFEYQNWTEQHQDIIVRNPSFVRGCDFHHLTRRMLGGLNPVNYLLSSYWAALLSAELVPAAACPCHRLW